MSPAALLPKGLRAVNLRVGSVTGVPQRVCNEFQLPHVKYFTRQPTGLATLLTLIILMLFFSAIYFCFEQSYSIANPPPARVLPNEKNKAY